MKITASHLRRIIKEEISRTLAEAMTPGLAASKAPRRIAPGPVVKNPAECEECGDIMGPEEKKAYEAENGEGWPRICSNCNDTLEAGLPTKRKRPKNEAMTPGLAASKAPRKIVPVAGNASPPVKTARRGGVPKCAKCNKRMTLADKHEYEADGGEGYPEICTDCGDSVMASEYSKTDRTWNRSDSKLPTS